MLDDLISRRAAIDALHHWFADIGFEEDRWWNSTHVLAALRNVPSVEPEVIRCKDCVYQTESWNEIKYCEAHGDHIGKDYDYCSNARRKVNGVAD